MRLTSWTTVTTNPMAPIAKAASSAVQTALAAPSALQVCGGQESRKAREKTPIAAATTPNATVRISAPMEMTRSVVGMGGFEGGGG